MDITINEHEFKLDAICNSEKKALLTIGSLSFILPEPDSVQLPSISFDDELIIFNKFTKKIITLNPTASYIWKLLNQRDNIDLLFSAEGIARTLLKTYELSADDYESVLCDVKNIIDLFIREKLLMPNDRH